MKSTLSLFLSSSMFLCLMLGCSSGKKESSCGAGDRLACSCATGGSGFRVCGADGVYGVCDCSATQCDAALPDTAVAPAAGDADTLDASIPADAATTLLALYSACAADGDCQSNFCFLYNDGSQLCTKTCTVSSDCPAPSTGCNNKGVCKNPK